MNLTERINRALARSKDADPQTIARKLMARMEQTDRDAALAECLADRVRLEIGRNRMHANDPAPARTEGPSKWRALIEPRVYVPEIGWQFEVDLTAAQMVLIAMDYASRADAMTAKAQMYQERAEQLEASGLETWGEYVAQVAAAA